MLARRNAHLNKILGMEYDKSLLGESTEVIPAEPQKEVVPVDESSLNTALKENQKHLEDVYEIAKGVLENSAEMCQNLSKSRDVEAFAALVGRVTELQANLVGIKEKRLGGEQKVPQTAIQQNTFNVNSTRELNSILRAAQKEKEEKKKKVNKKG